MNVFGIEKAFKIKKERGWDTLYWAIDFHDTLFKAKYDKDQSVELYPYAGQVLEKLCKSNNILIAFSSTPTDKVQKICDYCQDIFGIHFKYINENPEYFPKTDYADFSKKFYYNVLLDDKAGFDPHTDWELIKWELIRIGEW